MIVTTAWMEQWFGEFNRLYFGSGLPVPLFALSHARTQLGQMACKRTTRWGRTKLYDFTIKLSTYYDMTEEQAKNVLLHEIIHYSIAYTGVKDTAPHGIVWRGMADSLNRKHGWHIQAMTTTKGWKVADGGKPRKVGPPSVYLVLALRMRDGRHFLSSVNPRFARTIDRQLVRLGEIGNYGWYITHDAYFKDFPRCRSLRGRRVSVDVYEEKTAEMKQYVF